MRPGCSFLSYNLWLQFSEEDDQRAVRDLGGAWLSPSQRANNSDFLFFCQRPTPALGLRRVWSAILAFIPKSNVSFTRPSSSVTVVPSRQSTISSRASLSSPYSVFALACLTSRSSSRCAKSLLPVSKCSRSAKRRLRSLSFCVNLPSLLCFVPLGYQFQRI
jgi:hypothetical protein